MKCEHLLVVESKCCAFIKKVTSNSRAGRDKILHRLEICLRCLEWGPFAGEYENNHDEF